MSQERRDEIAQRAYDPRREARRQLARVPLPEDVDPRDLDSETRRQLMSLSKETAETVAKHLVVAGRLMDEDPEQALRHARAARALAGRIGPVREANGLVAYTAGEWAEALSELRAARRMTGDPGHLAVMADCERALGKPQRALQVAEDPQARQLDPAAKVELMIVSSGARRDLGQHDTAVALLQVPALEGPVRPWTARLRYAYADALLDAGREDEARTWFARAAEVDEQGETDAEERLLELDGMVLVDLDADGETDEEDPRSREVDTETFGASSQVSAPAPPSTTPALAAEIPVLADAGTPAESRPARPAVDVFQEPSDDDELRLFD